MLSGTVAFLILVSTPVAVSVHPPEIEARLAPLIGDWTIAGQEKTYREKCEWYRDKSFVVCTSEDSSDNSISQSILGYSKADGNFTYHNFGNGGSSNSRIGFPNGELGLVYTLERKTSAGRVRSTTYVTPQTDGRVHFREDRSLNGGPWSTAADFYYVPRK